MAMSLNGFVADETGSEDFISDKSWDAFCELAKEKGAFIIGRKTLEAVKTWGPEYSFDSLGDIPKIILTGSGVEVGNGFINASSPQEALQKLSELGVRSVLLGGGPTINSGFIKENLVDEIIFNIEPVIMGKGKPVFASEDFQTNLEFNSVKELAEGVIQVRYTVKR